MLPERADRPHPKGPPDYIDAEWWETPEEPKRDVDERWLSAFIAANRGPNTLWSHVKAIWAEIGRSHRLW